MNANALKGITNGVVNNIVSVLNDLSKSKGNSVLELSLGQEGVPAIGRLRYIPNADEAIKYPGQFDLEPIRLGDILADGEIGPEVNVEVSENVTVNARLWPDDPMQVHTLATMLAYMRKRMVDDKEKYAPHFTSDQIANFKEMKWRIRRLH